MSKESIDERVKKFRRERRLPAEGKESGPDRGEALEALSVLLDQAHQYAEDHEKFYLEEAHHTVRRALEAPAPYAGLPEKLTRHQAEVLCELEDRCGRGEVRCFGDCDCNSNVVDAWRELRSRIAAAKEDE